MPDCVEVKEGGSLTQKEGYEEGQFFIQDISSQYLVRELSQFLEKKEGVSGGVLDLCAAPGGKSMGMALNGLKVSATDIQPERLKRLRENLKRMNLESQVSLLPYEESVLYGDYDVIWVDAPCSGLGTLRRHPEISYHRQEKDVEVLREVQQQLLSKALRCQRPGKWVMYSVCSVLKSEGEDLVKSVLGKEAGSSERCHQWDLAPQDELGGDGFYAALLQKTQGSS